MTETTHTLPAAWTRDLHRFGWRIERTRRTMSGWQHLYSRAGANGDTQFMRVNAVETNDRKENK